jgi:hypothetical protein
VKPMILPIPRLCPRAGPAGGQVALCRPAELDLHFDHRPSPCSTSWSGLYGRKTAEQVARGLVIEWDPARLAHRQAPGGIVPASAP